MVALVMAFADIKDVNDVKEVAEVTEGVVLIE